MIDLSARELLSLPEVLAGMCHAFIESDVGGQCPIEQGGFLLRDFQSHEIRVERLPSSANDSLSFPHCPNGQHAGQEIVGSFHTHPNTGTEWQQEPSSQDIRLSKVYPETMGPYQFVISRETIYHIDNHGQVTVVGSTSELLNLNMGI